MKGLEINQNVFVFGGRFQERNKLFTFGAPRFRTYQMRTCGFHQISAIVNCWHTFSTLHILWSPGGYRGEVFYKESRMDWAKTDNWVRAKIMLG